MKFSLTSTFLIMLLMAVGAAAQTNKSERIESENQAAEQAGTRRQTLAPAVEAKLDAEKAALAPELKIKIVAFLKATGKDAQTLVLPENRVRHQTEAAGLLWQYDEKAARETFAAAMNDFRLILNSLDAVQQRLETGETDDDDSFLGFLGGGNESSRFYAAGNVRRNLLLAIGKRDGALAFEFLNETARPNFPNWNDAAFESQLAAVVAANDPARAVLLAQQKLAKNEFQGLGELAQNVYAKDKAKGAKLAQDLLKKLRAANAAENSGVLITASALFDEAAEILESGAPPSGESAPLLTESDTRELAEVLIKAIAAQQVKYNYDYFSADSSEQLFKRLQKYAPASLARLARQNSQNVEAAVEPAVPIISPPSAVATQANTTVAETVVTTNQNSNAAIAAANLAARREQQREAQNQAIAKLTETAGAPNAKISADQARQTLQSVRNRWQRLTALTQIIKSLSARGDRETAKTLFADAGELQIAQPRKATEMLQNLMLADAFARIEPERAFAVVESTIYECNSVISSFARIGDFIGAREIADNGEFNMGSLPGEFLQIQNGGASLGLDFVTMFRNLAAADFARTAALADKFDKPEIRLEAQMLIARMLLPAEPQETMKSER